MRRAALLALALCACADEPGRFHPDTVLALARSRGDAVGTAHTGTWNARLTERECSCGGLEDPAGVPTSFCFDPATLGMLSLEITESDGVLRMLGEPVEAPTPTPLAQLLASLFSPIDLQGRIDDDGELAIGAVKSASSVVGRARVVWRADGTITDFDAPMLGSIAELEAELFLFMRADIADVVETCGAHYDVHATMPLQAPWSD